MDGVLGRNALEREEEFLLSSHAMCRQAGSYIYGVSMPILIHTHNSSYIYAVDESNPRLPSTSRAAMPAFDSVQLKTQGCMAHCSNSPLAFSRSSFTMTRSNSPGSFAASMSTRACCNRF